MRKNGWCFGKIARTFNIFILLLLTCSSTNAIPLHQSHNDSSLEQEDTTLLNSIQKLETTTNRVRKNQTVSIKPRLLNSIEWRQLTTSPENLITQVAFDVGSHFTPTYAYITSDSYKKYVDDLEEKCRKAKDNNNIADMRVENLDHEYFRWEENQFNKALLHRLFPETTQGDHSRFLKATNIIHHIRLGTELDNQCQVVEHHDDWSYSVDEKTQFEDYLINRIFQPQHSNEYAQAIIREFEADRLEHHDQPHNLTSPDRSKRSILSPAKVARLQAKQHKSQTRI